MYTRAVSTYFFKLLVLLTAVVLGGYAASIGEPALLVAALGMTVGLFIVFDATLLLLVTLIGGFVISGVTQLYVPQVQLIRWAFGATATLLLLHVLFQAVITNTLRFKIDSTILFWALVFIVVLISSALFQNVKLSVALISLKGYLQMWGVLFALALLPWSEERIKKLPIFMLAVALIQIPFVLHQYLILVPLRMGWVNNVDGLVPIDIVSGTFGGKLDHGGANAALTVLCFIVAACILNLWKNRQITTSLFLILIVSVAFPAFINSTKISAFFLFAILLTTYSEEIYFNPIKFLTRLLATLMLCVILALSVISSLPEDAQVNSLGDLYQQTYNYNIAEDNIRDNYLSRSGTIKAWFNPIKAHKLEDMIVGYGIGSSRIIESDAGRRISRNINIDRPTGVTALAAVLWEAGIVGIIALTMLFVSAFLVATRLKRYYAEDLFHRSIFTGLQCSVLILFISLGHKSFFVFHIGYQTIFVVMFGYLVFWERKMVTSKTQKGQTDQA